VASRAIIGLGNPGARYAGTRHNAGFLVVERLAARHALPWQTGGDGLARVADGRIAGLEVRLIEPLTYMNRSGEVLEELATGLAPADLLVVHDEVDLPFARLKLKSGGGNAGHRGLRSIQEHLGGDANFARLRVGVGRPPAGIDTADWVLAEFGGPESDRLADLLEAAADGCEAWLSLDFMAAVNRVHAPPTGPGEPGGPSDGAPGGPPDRLPAGKP